MIEVNFFEKKARNVLPHVMIAFFLIGLLAISVYFFLLHGLYVSEANQNNQIIQQQSEDVELARDMQAIDGLTVQNNQTIMTLENEQYPIVYLTEAISDIIPNSEEAVLSFDLSDGNTIVLQLNQSAVENSADLIVAFEELTYTSRVQMNRLEQLSEDGDVFMELSLIVDESALREEAVQ